jgi:signal transduction histidine kinase/CheY-like chemotaxis protein
MTRTLDKGVMAALGLLVALLVASAALNYRNTWQLKEDAAWVAHTHEVLDLTGDALRTLVEAEAGVRGFYISGREEFLHRYDIAVQGLDAQLDALKEKTKDNDNQRSHIEQLRKMSAERLQQLQAAIDQKRQAGKAFPRPTGKTDGKALMDAIREHVVKMERQETDLLKDREGRSNSSYQVAVTTGLLSAFVGLFLVGAFVWLLDRNLRGKLKTVAERQRIEEELRQNRKELQERVKQLAEADRRKDEFLATLAHELRNPLAPICNAVELLRRANGDTDRIDQVRGLMERQLGHMVRLIDDLLDISRITNGKLQLRKERLELAAVVHSAVESSRPLIEASAHNLTVKLPPDPIYVDADPTRLAQAFSNLLNNAAKYTERSGQICLTVDLNGSQAVVSVRDNGVGISAEHLPHIFEMFSQVAPALERSQGGLGIGLALVRGLVALHGGTVEAHSDGPGRGSEFRVHLPVAEPKTPVKANDNGHLSPVATKSRILVVDDLRDSAESLGMVLELKGHTIRIAHDGREAVQAAAAFRPDVILMDIGLPKMNGYEAAREIRHEPWGKSMILVALTGWGQDEDKRRAAEAGFDHHMTKPVDPATLEGLLSRRVTRK